MESNNEMITPTEGDVDDVGTGAAFAPMETIVAQLCETAGTEWHRNAEGNMVLDCAGARVRVVDVLAVFFGWRYRPTSYAERMRLDAVFDAFYERAEFDPFQRLWWELARKWWGLRIMPDVLQLHDALAALEEYPPSPKQQLDDEDDTILPESKLVDRMAYIADLGRPADRAGRIVSPISARLTRIIWSAMVWQSMAPVENGRSR
jgi:hypothetical protein